MTSHREFDEKTMETETRTWSEFPNVGKAIVEQILATEETKKPRRAGLWEYILGSEQEREPSELGCLR